jgi:radical SAM superfamily enzyme YgiQ (UPF0313 family)
VAAHKRERFVRNRISRRWEDGPVDVLLVYPIWITQAGWGRLQRMLPPLGILSIASFLESKGYKVHIVDLHAEAIGPDRFREILRNLRPRFVGMTVLSSHFIPAHHLAHLCKEELPHTRVIAGGVHAEAYPEHMLKNPAIDAVCRGDGEETMLEFVEGREPGQIPGLSYRRGNRVIHNPPRPVDGELDRYPFPAYHLIDFDHYFPGVGTYKNFPAMNALMTRGCPGKCTFCNSAKTTLRGRSPEKMVEMIQLLRERHGIRQISFYDDTFTADPRNVRTFCKLMIEKKVDVTFVCNVRGDMFGEEMAKLLAQAGCHQVLLGIEAGSPEIAQNLGKRIEREKYKKAVETAHRNGIEVRGGFIIGHIEETEKSLEETLELAAYLELDFFQPSILTPYPGTQLYKDAKERGLLIHENYDVYGQGEVVLKMDNLSSERLLQFYYQCFIRFYFQPKVILKQLKRLRHLRQVIDLFKSFYVLVVQGLIKVSGSDLRGWLDFDVDEHAIRLESMPDRARLSFEVRQAQTFL